MKKTLFINFVIVAVFILSVIFLGLSKAYAHCDTMGGPVVKDAKVALEKKDVTSVLKWVKKEKEPEVRAAFEVALTERAKSPEAKEKADMKFFETLAKIHREGEGEPFTGIKPADAIEPIEAEADKALDAGSVDTLTIEMSQHLTGGVKERFDRVLDKKKHMDDSVDAGREYVEAYVEYLHYVEGVHMTIAGKVGHHPEEADGDEHKEHRGLETASSKQEGAMNNILENIPYQEQKMGSRKLVDEKYLLVMQAALKPGQSVPQHSANSNVHILVVRGEVVIDLNGTESLTKEGALVPIAYKTSMSIMNKSNKDASFLIVKTPNPSEMVGE